MMAGFFTHRWRAASGYLLPSTPVKILSHSGVARLDIGPECVATAGRCKDAPSNRLTLRRLDGPSAGPVCSAHAVAIRSPAL